MYPEIMPQMYMIILSIILGVRGVPSLDESTQIRLQATVDGRDSRGEGFAALVDHARSWQPPFDDAQHANLRRIMEEPSLVRGVLFTIEGVVQQQSSLRSPWDDVNEWFVRDEHGVLFTLYVVGEIDFSDGMRVTSLARFYKTISIQGRDNQVRLYPTFVTSSSAINPIANGSILWFPWILLPVLAIASIVVFTLGRIGKHKTVGRQFTPKQTEQVLDAVRDSTSTLPDNPAQALATMYEQSEEES